MSKMLINNSKEHITMTPSQFSRRKRRQVRNNGRGNQSVVRNIACPSCREKGGDSTGNHLMVFEDGGGYCNRCPKKFTKEQVDKVTDDRNIKPSYSNTNNRSPSSYQYSRNHKVNLTLEDMAHLGSIGDKLRKISSVTDRHFGIKTEISVSNRSSLSRYYPYYVKDTLFGYKKRILPKDWGTDVGTTKGTDLFGWNLLTGSRKVLIIVEGEEDCAAGWQMWKELNKKSTNIRIRRSNPHIVSLPNGAKGVSKSLLHHFDDLMKYEKIIWCGDNYKIDKDGAEAMEVAVQIIGIDKLYIAEYPDRKKDLCDVLDMGTTESVDAFAEMYFNAKKYQPADIKDGCDYSWESVFSKPIIGHDIPFKTLSDKIGGFRLREHTVILAPSGAGKTTVCRTIGESMATHHNWKVGSMFLEEKDTKTVQGFVAAHLGVALNIIRKDPDMISEEERESAMNHISNNHMFLTHNGSICPEVLMNKVRYMYSKGCKLIIFDHLTMAINGETDQRVALDDLMEQLYVFCENHDVHILSVIHLNRDSKNLFSHGAEITDNAIRGSAGVIQQSWNCIAIECNLFHETLSNARFFRVLKCREIGDLGLCDGGYLYNEITGKLSYDSSLNKDMVDPRMQQKSSKSFPTMGVVNDNRAS